MLVIMGSAVKNPEPVPRCGADLNSVVFIAWHACPISSLVALTYYEIVQDFPFLMENCTTPLAVLNITTFEGEFFAYHETEHQKTKNNKTSKKTDFFYCLAVLFRIICFYSSLFNHREQFVPKFCCEPFLTRLLTNVGVGGFPKT